MKDILGREIKEKDLVIGMIISRYSDGMRFGVRHNDMIYWDVKYTKKSVCSNLYLVETPNEKELEIRQNILKIIKEDEESKQKLKEIKALKNIEVGHIYETTSGLEYAYLGKGKVIDIHGKEKEGHIYIYTEPYGVREKKIETMEFTQENRLNIEHVLCLKSKKKFYKDTGKTIDICGNYIVFTGMFFDRHNSFRIWQKKHLKMEIILEEKI